MLMQKDFKNNIKLKNAVWEKAVVVPGSDPDVWRKDVAGAWIKRDQYGNRNDELNHGWEIDHQKPVAKKGADDLSNLRPLQWKNNCSKGDDYPTWKSAVSSSGNGHDNIYKVCSWIIK